MRKSCEIPGCDRPASSKGLCSGHYQRVLKHGDPMAGKPLRVVKSPGELPKICSVEGCGRPAHSRGYCNAHYQRLLKYGDPLAAGKYEVKSRQEAPMIEAARNDRGNPVYKVTCDVCGHEEEVAAMIGSNGKAGHGQVSRKLQQKGWTYLKKTLRCPTCEKERKEGNQVKKPAEKPEVEAPAQKPTRAQKREIMDLLEDVYDVEAERYKSGDTDSTVAEVLDVMPGWVAEIREEFFGPDGASEDMSELEGRINAARSDIQKLLQNVGKIEHEAREGLAALSSMAADLDRIKQAVGPNARAKAGVK